MTNRIEDLAFMGSALEQALTQGVDSWANDTQARKDWRDNDPLATHVFATTMLIGLFSYSEGRLGRRWWEQLNSASARRDFEILWLARNSFVHNDSKMVVSQFLSITQLNKFAEYHQDIINGDILDDHGNVYPVFMSLNGSELCLNEKSFHIFKSLFSVAYRAERLGRL